jgi:hypothetical protein
MESAIGYRRERVPKSRKLIIESCEYALKKQRMLGLFEADVTNAREKLSKHEEQLYYQNCQFPLIKAQIWIFGVGVRGEINLG